MLPAQAPAPQVKKTSDQNQNLFIIPRDQLTMAVNIPKPAVIPPNRTKAKTTAYMVFSACVYEWFKKHRQTSWTGS